MRQASSRPYTDYAEEERFDRPPPTDEVSGVIKYKSQEEFEHTLSDHEYVKEPYADEYGSMKSGSTNKRAAMKKWILVSVFIVLLVIIGSLAISTASSKKNKQGNSQVSASEASVSNAASKGYTPAPTMAPISTAPTTPAPGTPAPGTPAPGTPAPGSPAPATKAPTRAPMGVCTSAVTVDETCYNIGDTITVDFTSCFPGEYEWIALYKAGADFDGKLYDTYKYWEWTCGGRGNPCEDPVSEGTISFRAKVGSGAYQVYLVSGDNEPYNFIAVSEAFKVRKDCHSDGGMPAGHSYPDVPAASPKPTPSPMYSDGGMPAGHSYPDKPVPKPKPTTKPPSKAPTTIAPTKLPSKAPSTSAPTRPPSKAPSTSSPTRPPSKAPSTSSPTKPPTKSPTRRPTKPPTKAPTRRPTKSPKGSAQSYGDAGADNEYRE